MRDNDRAMKEMFARFAREKKERENS